MQDDEEGAISCVIRGQSEDLRTNAKAFKCHTTEELYYGYLSSLENYKKVAANTTRNTVAPTRATWRGRPIPQEKLCYTCRRPEHESRDCRSLLVYTNCSRRGHESTSSWFPEKMVMYDFKTYEIMLDCYRKLALINNYEICD